MDPTQYLPPVAGGGTLLILGYGVRMFMEWVQQLRAGNLEKKKLDLAEDTQQVTDAAAANAIMLDTLQAVRQENARLDSKVTTLEARNAEKDAKIEKLQQELQILRSQVNQLLHRLDGVDFELDDLRDNT
jgi:septal ring factor EnvC (AmiA/AmiB activator)